MSVVPILLGASFEPFGSGPSWNPIGLLQITITVLWIRDTTLILLKRKMFDGNSLGYALFFGPVVSCFVAWLLGYWWKKDASFLITYFLTLPSGAFLSLTLFWVYRFQPTYNQGMRSLLFLDTGVLIKRFSKILIFYCIAVFLWWAGFKTGFLLSEPACVSLTCQAGQGLIGSGDKIFFAITVLALTIQNALGVVLTLLGAIVIKICFPKVKHTA